MENEIYGSPEKPAAIVIRAHTPIPSGIHFLTPDDYSQQLGAMNRPAGYKVPAHRHNLVERKISVTQEVLLLRSGTCHVKLFDEGNEVFAEIELGAGDLILLAHGGHEIIMLTDCQLLEVKQGPYAGENDKTIFGSKD
jgi:hypothetical protein